MANSQTFTLNIKAVADMKDVVSNISNIQSALGKLKLPDNLKNSFKQTFNNLEKELANYQRITSGGIKTKGDASALEKSGNNILRLYDEVVKKINSIDNSTLKKAFEDLGAEKIKSVLDDLKRLEDQLKQKISTQNFINFDDTKNQLKTLKADISKMSDEAQKAFKTISGSTLNTLFKNIETGRLDLATKNLESIRQKVEQIKNEDLTKWFTQLQNGFNQLTSDTSITNLTDEIEKIKSSLPQLEANTLQGLIDGFNQGKISAEGLEKGIQQIITAENERAQSTAQANKEIDQVKNRIQYFFGLNNAINLVKRGIREAINTVKELDKAMTETAVVTSNTISDMWAKLPDYTKRANELGVSTLETYQAATLYYQQGLNDEQAAALSTETLKMARIAGLDAAEATDRMTNALRGFNMELNEVSAQKVDDVYSQLAAMSASNVDEISTAMTKVASLAHSANMEFETTAAFLAQIIETTRESAETAGTALKTVVARFSEVKKLYDMDELKGKDEEGQSIDVNKVSSALRTAGIDLNKYFLGEVGLDDIFMELASKWDSLTSVQQRYIATQAAGSRQQSRFIALMQDYARTQQLVSAAYDANGASAKQFEKTQDSLQSKLARLSNAWHEFLMGLANSRIIKFAVDGLTLLINGVNKLTGVFGNGIGTILKWTAAIAGIAGLKKAFSDTGIATKGIKALFNGTPLGRLFGLSGEKGQETAANLAMIEQVKAAWLAAIEQIKGAAIASEAAETSAAVTGETIEGTAGVTQEKVEEAAAIAGEAAEAKAATAFKGFAQTVAAASGTAAAAPVITSGAPVITATSGAAGGAAGGAAAGLGTIAIPAAIITAIVAAVVGTVAVQDYFKSGKREVKAAEKAVVTQQKAAEQQKKVADLQSDAYKRYLENEKVFNNSTDRVEKANAKAAMAGALADLASVNKDNVINNNGVYTVNKKYAQQLEQNLKEKENVTEATGYLAQAALQYAQAQKAEKAVMINTAYGKYGQWENAGGSWWQDTKWDLTHIGLNADERYLAIQSHNAAQEAKAASYYASAEAQMQAAVSGLLEGKYSDEIINSVASSYAKLFDSSAFNNEIQKSIEASGFAQIIAGTIVTPLGAEFTSTWAKSLINYSSNKQEYEGIFGYGSAEGLNPKELATALAQYNATLGVNDKAKQLADLAIDKNGSVILDIINSTFDQFYQGGELESALDKLTSSQKNTLAEILGVEVTELQDTLTQYSTSLIKAQSKIRKNTIRVLTKAGVKNTQYLDEVSTQLTMSQQTELTKVAETFSGYGLQFNDTIAETFSNALMNDTYDDVFKDFVESISDNPILAYDTLKQAAEGTNQELRGLVEQLGLINKISGKFDVSGFEQFSRQNLVQSFFASDAYDNLTEQVEKFIEANGRITSANIEELSDECNTLSILLDNDIMSAEGLAIAFSALAEDNITLFDLNENVLELYNSFDSVANAIQRAGQFIKDFDPGEDWGDAFDFIDGAIEKMQGFIDNRELGNPQLRNYWKAFFTTDPKDLEDWEAGLAILKELQGNGGADFWTKAVGFSMDENGVIADMGIDAFASSSFNNYKDYIKSLAESNGFTQFTDEYYDLMLRNMGDHDYGVLTDIAAVEMDKMMTAYGEGMPSKADIQAIADGYGIEPQDVLDAWLAKYGDGTQLDFSELEDKIRRTTTSIKDAAETALSGLREDFINGRVGLGDTEGEASRAWNANMGNTSWILQQLGAGSDGTFSIDTLYAKIGQIIPEVQDGTMTPQEWVQEQIDKSPDGKVILPVDFDYQEKIGDNQYKTQHFHADVEIDSVEGYEKAVSDAMAEANAVSLSQPIQDAITEANSLAEIIATLGTENNISAVKGEITNCITDANTLNTTLGQTINKTVVVNAEPSSIEISGAGSTISFSISAVASGGVVKSAASGTVNPGLALTGEEAPEIVWNKQKGYAYLAGKNGPEINNLQPGDEVFNGEQTKQILKRSGISSFAKGTISSYAGTIWKRDEPSSSKSGGSGGSRGGGGSGGSGKEKTPEEWKNELDWLYNLMEDIAELERDQKAIEEQYEDLLQDQTKTGGDLYRLLVKQLGNLYTQLNHQTFALEKREQEMREFMDITNDQDQYLWYNWQDRTLEIDWDAIDQITDEEQYKHVKELIDEAEEIQDKIDDADDSIMDITNQIQELENIWRDTFIDFEDRVLDAIIKSYQQIIDNYSELNDTLNNSNTQILDSLQKQISLERQIRDNTKTEEEISDEEARLAYLRRDTSGGNDLAALQLERELADQRESYEDTLVDQAISRLQEDNDAAAQQRERQIEIMQAQLDYQSENGEFNAYISELLTTAMGADGELLTNSDLVTLLKEQENWDAMSAVSKQVWDEELNGTFKEVAAFLLKENAEQNGTFYTALTEAVKSVSTSIGSYSQAMVKLGNSISSIGSSGGYSGGGSGSSGGSGGSSSKTSQSSNVFKAWTPGDTMRLVNTGSGYYYQTIKKHAKGGLNTQTGLAWLDGTPQEPEYVLNARQTDAFLKLADVLPSMMNGMSTTTSNTFGSTYVNLSVNLESVSPDYDVDRMVDLVKDKLYDSSMYRNNNVLSFLR